MLHQPKQQPCCHARQSDVNVSPLKKKEKVSVIYLACLQYYLTPESLGRTPKEPDCLT